MNCLWFDNAESAGENGSFFFLPFQTTHRGGGLQLRRMRLASGRRRGTMARRCMPFEASPMPFEISDEGNFHSARLFGVLDRTDLDAVMNEVQRLEDEGVLRDRLTDLTALDRIDVGFEEVFALAQRRGERKVPAPIRSALGQPAGSVRLCADVPDAQRQSADPDPDFRQSGGSAAVAAFISVITRCTCRPSSASAANGCKASSARRDQSRASRT